MDAKIDHILCTIDFSEFTAPVIQTGIHLAARSEATLTIFHSVYRPRDALYGDDVFSHDQNLSEAAAQAKKQIETLLSDCPVNWSPMVAIGEPVEELERFTKKAGTDLIVAATYGFSGLKRMFLGTVVERMVRVLSQPMLIIRPTETDNYRLPKYRKIVVACDLSIDPEPLIPMALALAGENAAEFYLFHANPAPVNEDIIDPTDAPYQQVQQALQMNQAKKLMTAVPDWARDRYGFETILRPGRPDEALIGYMAENNPDLIAIGVKRSRLKRLLIGSTTENILRRAACTVLTVPIPVDSKKP